jgi:N-acylneuraminate cytidylyltransferase
MKKKRLLIIPAKSFSQRIKNKNFKNFFGKPIIEYPYNAAKKSKIFDKIHISTESETIKRRLEKKGINIDFLRPKKLTEDTVGVFEVYKFVVKEFQKKGLIFHEIWSLLPCTPLIDHFDLQRLKNKIDNNQLKKPIISVSKYNAPIEWAFKLNSKNNKLIPLNKKKQFTPSQKLRELYYDTGAIAVFNFSNFQNNSKFYNGYFYGFELHPEKNVDIDDLNDWRLAKKLFNKN